MGTAWLDAFVEACTNCTIDGVAAHWYGGKGVVNEVHHNL